MIDQSMQFKRNQSKGLGYNHVPPPFNHSYVSKPLSKEEIANESFMIYGKPSGFVSGGFINVESTNISTSPADQSLNQSIHEVEGSVSENKTESEPEVLVLNKDFNFSDVESDNVFCEFTAPSDTGLNVFKVFDEMVDNFDVCNDTNKNSPFPQVTPSDTPSLISQPTSCSCSCEKSKGVGMENKYEKNSTGLTITNRFVSIVVLVVI